MKKRNWILWLFEDNDKIDLLKIMEFKPSDFAKSVRLSNS